MRIVKPLGSSPTVALSTPTPLETSINLGNIGATPAPGVPPVPSPNGEFGGSLGFVPIASAAAGPAVTAAPAVANGAAQPNINVSGLTLSSVLNLGNLAQQTASLQ